MQKIDRTKVSAAFAKNEGAFFSASFRKLNGEYRPIEGIILRQDDLATRYLTVYDTENEGVRRVNIETLSRLEIAGKDFFVTG